MIVQVVTLEVQAGKLEVFLQEVQANVRASREEPGVVQFDLLQSEDQPERFMLYEVYRTAADLEAHRITPHFQRWLEAGVPLLAGARQRSLYRVVA